MSSRPCVSSALMTASGENVGPEQRRLRPEVLLGRAVEIEVVVAEVGEDDGVERRPVDAMQGQRVRRHLEHCGGRCRR